MANKADSTASRRMAEWRQRMKAEGWKSFNIWLPADDARALDGLMDESDDSRRDTLTRTLAAGIRNDVTDDAEQTIADLKDTIRHLKRERVTLTEADYDLLDMAARYLSGSRDKARKHTAEQLRELVERLES